MRPRNGRNLRKKIRELEEINDDEYINIVGRMYMEHQRNPDIHEHGLLGVTTFKEEYKEPTTYKQMMRRHARECEKWLEGVKKELDNYEKRGVWRIIKKGKVPPGRKLIGSKWVFKLNRDGRYRSRLVALGYSQIPGVDFKDNYSPVVSDITVKNHDHNANIISVALYAM